MVLGAAADGGSPWSAFGRLGSCFAIGRTGLTNSGFAFFDGCTTDWDLGILSCYEETR